MQTPLVLGPEARYRRQMMSQALLVTSVVVLVAAAPAAANPEARVPPSDQGSWTQEQMNSARADDHTIVGRDPHPVQGAVNGTPGAAGGSRPTATAAGSAPGSPTRDGGGSKPTSKSQRAPSGGSAHGLGPSSRAAAPDAAGGRSPGSPSGAGSGPRAPAAGSGGTAVDGTAAEAASTRVPPSVRADSASSQSDDPGPLGPQAWVALVVVLVAATGVAVGKLARRPTT